MAKIKRYIECYIPTETCNLRCHYCYIALQEKFGQKIAKFSHTKQEIRQAFSQKRLGGPCLINICAGGETLLSDEVLPIVKELILEGHYISLVTNGTVSKRFDEIAQWSAEILSHLFIKFSFHYLEFIRLGVLDRFFGNVKRMKAAGVSITVEITPSDELVPHIDEVKKICEEQLGSLCHVTIARDDRTSGIDVLSQYDFESYKELWGVFESELFEFKKTIFYEKRREFCYAGDWSFCVNLETGELSQCYNEKKFGNIYDLTSPIQFKAVGCNCSLAHCYNGHAFLALGAIPELQTPSYDQLRNRKCADGTEWLKPEMKSAMATKLCETNRGYGKIKKYRINHPHWWQEQGKRIKKKLRVK